MSFCSPVYAVFGGPHNLPQIPNSFPANSMAAKEVKNTAFSQQVFAAKNDFCCHWDSRKTIGNLGWVVGSTKNCIYRATKRHLNIFDISSSLEVAPIWKWVHLFGPGSKIVLFANFHQFQIRILTFDLIFDPETLRIWGRLWGPPKSTYIGLQKDTLTSLISLMVWLHDPCREKCL